MNTKKATSTGNVSHILCIDAVETLNKSATCDTLSHIVYPGVVLGVAVLAQRLTSRNERPLVNTAICERGNTIPRFISTLLNIYASFS